MTNDDNFGPWIDWAGGPCPIPDAKAGEFELRFEKKENRPIVDAVRWVWEHNQNKGHNIIAYRVRLPADGGFADYDAGLLNDFGGGNVEWWQDYLRAEIGRANEFWREQLPYPDPLLRKTVDALRVVQTSVSPDTIIGIKIAAVLAAAAERGL